MRGIGGFLTSLMLTDTMPSLQENTLRIFSSHNDEQPLNMFSYPSLCPCCFVPSLGGGLVRLPHACFCILDCLPRALLEAHTNRFQPNSTCSLCCQSHSGGRCRDGPSPSRNHSDFAHHDQNVTQYGDVLVLTLRANQIRLVRTILGQDRPHAGRAVVRMNLVARILPVTVQLRAKNLEDVLHVSYIFQPLELPVPTLFRIHGSLAKSSPIHIKHYAILKPTNGLGLRSVKLVHFPADKSWNIAMTTPA